MAHHKSAIKRIRRNDRANVRNSQYLSTVKSAVKKLRLAVAAGDKAALGPLFISAQSMLAKAATKGLLHKNNAVRKISRLSKLLKSVESGAPVAAAKTAKKSPAKKAAGGAKKTPAAKAKSTSKKK